MGRTIYLATLSYAYIYHMGGGGTQILHLWNVYLHLVDFYGKSLGFQAHLVDFYGVHVGKYTVRPMDPLGKASIVGKAHCWHHISP